MIWPADLRTEREILLAAGRPSAKRLAEAIDAILAGEEPRAALGWVGVRNPLIVDRENRRDDELRRWRARHYRRETDLAAATDMASRWNRFRCPAALSLNEVETHRGFCWRLTVMGAEPLSVRRIRAIIALENVGHGGGMAVANESREDCSTNNATVRQRS